mgnify:CR=1 FL=1
MKAKAEALVDLGIAISDISPSSIQRHSVEAVPVAVNLAAKQFLHHDIGAVIETEGLVQACGDIVGYLDGRPIHAAVDFMGMRYRFENVVPPSYRHRVGPRELYVPPGLLYVTD